MAHIPDLVQVSRLETHFHSEPEYTQHVQYVSGSAPRQRKVRKEERWKRERAVGRGSFGTVWLERCIQGDSEREVRAVKKLHKLKSSDYYRELEAIALFSHSQYERCFVKSFGWYDDPDSIFITMEYLQHGDLHQYLATPLQENEGQLIVSQILEGLHFMHDKGFAHRDLKPANILVVYKGPDWWVKIADFGISKRAIEGLTDLRTLTGTPAFTAPEVLGFVQSSDRPNDSYTNAVDIWSLGVITFLILTGETLFKDQRRLGRYVRGSFQFPSDLLLLNKVSEQGCDFIRSSMAPRFEDRPRAKECLQHPWLDFLIEAAAPETQRESNVSKSPISLVYTDPEPSASWSTQDQISAYDTYSSTDVITERVASIFDGVMSLSTSEPAIRMYWTMGRTLKDYSGSVFAVAFSPDGKQMASAGFNKTVRLRDSATGAMRGTLVGHSNRIYAVAFSPDGKQIASAGDDKTVRLWDLATGAMRDTLVGHSKGVNAVAFSPNGKQIASAGDDKTVRLWDLATGATRDTLVGHSKGVNAVAFSPNGKQIASGGDKTIRLWDSATGATRGTLVGHSYWVSAVAFSPDGKQIASAGDTTVRLWDSATGATRGTLVGHSNWVNAVAFSPDGKQIASAGDTTIRLWDSATGAAHGTLVGHSNRVNAVAFSPDGKQIASAGDTTVRLWDSATEEPLAKDSTTEEPLAKDSTTEEPLA